MSHNDPLMRAALSECESVARSHGHTLGRWQKVTEEMHVSMCVVCSKLTWVTRSKDDKRWRLGGSVLKQEDCLVEDALRSSSED
jgi:hypothetical protein